MNNSTRLIRTVFMSGVLLAVLHVCALSLFLYWFYWWFDMPLHIFGGFCVSLFVLWAYFFGPLHRASSTTSARVLFVALLGACVLGLLWEIFEYKIGITFDTLGDHTLDTVKDLVMDITGGYLAYTLFVIKGYHRNLHS